MTYMEIESKEEWFYIYIYIWIHFALQQKHIPPIKINLKNNKYTHGSRSEVTVLPYYKTQAHTFKIFYNLK